MLRSCLHASIGQDSEMTAASSPAPDTVLILGGGLMGLAIAHQLARRAIPVTVLSRRRSEAAGFVAAGMLAPHALDVLFVIALGACEAEGGNRQNGQQQDVAPHG